MESCWTIAWEGHYWHEYAYPQQTQTLIFIDGLPLKRTEHSYFTEINFIYQLFKMEDVILERYFLNQTSFQQLLSSAYSQDADSASYLVI